ncbi:hypothetical protein A8A12_12210 [Serratia marcescens]|nr:hypothetical protein A8A12_12210 [Serratia marcescens]
MSATGQGNGAKSGDIAIVGSALKAGGDTRLDADRDLLLLGAANTQKTEGSNKSSGGNIGASLGFGQQTGLSVFANANKSQGREKGDGTFWSEATVDSGGTLSMHSGRDTRLTGAQAGGATVKVDAERHLTLQSQQDSDNYDAKQSSVSGGMSVAVIGAGGSANLSMSRDKLHSKYDSVQEQTGLFAGAGGYDIKVGEHTQLDGAVLASRAEQEKNRLETGTLGGAISTIRRTSGPNIRAAASAEPGYRQRQRQHRADLRQGERTEPVEGAKRRWNHRHPARYALK